MGLASNDPDIRWQQRFANYCKALEQLELFFAPPALNAREQQGLIKAFEVTFELAWNTLRDLLRSQGNGILIGSRESWMLMIQDRNLTSHTYNRSTADDSAANVNSRYLACFQQLRERLHQLQHTNG
ncbi:MAG: nucleotidyltransferase [Cyanobacteria bacterium K_DeepCast_150m_m2_101]|nr:nucleotidyltransferase [Cyanobacteria bacterium K_DeepCast_150m_m2_101]